MKTKLWIALLSLYIVWGSTYLAIRFAVETIPPFMHASLRFLISGLILYGWRRAAGDPAPTLSQWKSTAIVGAALLLGGNGLVAWAEQTVPSGIAALLITTSPFWLVLFEAMRAGGTRGCELARTLPATVRPFLLIALRTLIPAPVGGSRGKISNEDDEKVFNYSGFTSRSERPLVGRGFWSRDGG